MDADDYNSGYGRSTLHLPPPRSLTGTILKLGAVAGFLWLALATAALYLLSFDSPASRLDLVEWAAVIAAVCGPLALIGVAVMVGLRIDAARGALLVGHAQALFDNASSSMHAEIDGDRKSTRLNSSH